MSKAFRIGVIGTGRMGQLHLTKISALPQVQVIGFFEPNDTVAAHVVERFGVPRFREISQLLMECEGAVVSAPTPQHYFLGSMVLEQGRHLLIEKPPCETTDQAFELEAKAVKSGVILQVGFLERYRLKAMLAKATQPVGKIQYIEFQRLTPQVGREPWLSVIDDTMIHDLDLVLSMFRGEIQNLEATAYSLITPLIDVASSRFFLSTGEEVSLTASRVAESAQRTIRIIGSEGFLSLNLLTNEVFQRKRSMTGHHTAAETFHLNLDPLGDEWLDFVSRAEGRGAALPYYPTTLEVLKLRDRLLSALVHPEFTTSKIVASDSRIQQL